MRKPILSPFTIRAAITKPKAVHFIGIGGIGISSLAQWFLSRKWAVTGSDIASSETAKTLGKLGVKVKIGHKKANVPKGAGFVIYSQAIRPENPELREAKRLGIPCLSYPQALGELTRQYDTIAVAGMHGKSTTTAFVGLMLVKAGLDPTVIIGTKLKEFGGNFRNGKSRYLVIEADEYGGAFLNYSPALSVVTNIDREHLDYYKNLGDIKKSFLKFFQKTRPGGALVLNKDNKILWSLRKQIKKIADKRKLIVRWYGISINQPLYQHISAVIRIPGRHNISNALAALRAGMFLGVSQKTVLKAIGEYRGSWRRMQYRGTCRMPHAACRIYDDYAHHPTEIKATLLAFREKFPRPGTGRGSPRNREAAKRPLLICVFQPHQAERLKALFREFQSAFNEADITLILPIYRVPGRDPSTSSGQAPKVDSQKLVRAIQKKYPRKAVFYLEDPKKLKDALNVLIRHSGHSDTFVNSDYVVVMMGAGDIVNYTDSLLKN